MYLFTFLIIIVHAVQIHVVVNSVLYTLQVLSTDMHGKNEMEVICVVLLQINWDIPYLVSNMQAESSSYHTIISSLLNKYGLSMSWYVLIK